MAKMVKSIGVEAYCRRDQKNSKRNEERVFLLYMLAWEVFRD